VVDPYRDDDFVRAVERDLAALPTPTSRTPETASRPGRRPRVAVFGGDRATSSMFLAS
jgi:hypothetical protein